MYRILDAKTLQQIGVTESPRYIRKNENGVFVESDKSDAQGIAHLGIAYQLQGKENIGASVAIVLSEFDGGSAFIKSDDVINALLGVE